MDPLHLAHLILVSAWGGLVLGEGAMELGARDDDSRRMAARFHYVMDLAVELPLIAGVFTTGVLLTLAVWPPTLLHCLKIGTALVAIGLNLICVAAVVRRHRHLDDPTAVLRESRLVLLSGLGVPFALVAAGLGLTFFR